MVNYVLSTLKAVSVIFAFSGVVTGSLALKDPIAFSHGFGLPVGPSPADKSKKVDSSIPPTVSSSLIDQSKKEVDHAGAAAYISLMGVRQLTVGVIVLTFAYQGKWSEIATILAISGISVAGTDGFYLHRSGATSRGATHSIPGVLISLLSVVALKSL